MKVLVPASSPISFFFSFQKFKISKKLTGYKFLHNPAQNACQKRMPKTHAQNACPKRTEYEKKRWKKATRVNWSITIYIFIFCKNGHNSYKGL